MTTLEVGHVLELRPEDYRRADQGRVEPGGGELRIRVTELPDRLSMYTARWLILRGVEILDQGEGGEVGVAVRREVLPGCFARIRLDEPHFMDRGDYEC